jgi:hypothetical protein
MAAMFPTAPDGPGRAVLDLVSEIAGDGPLRCATNAGTPATVAPRRRVAPLNVA